MPPTAGIDSLFKQNIMDKNEDKKKEAEKDEIAEEEEKEVEQEEGDGEEGEVSSYPGGGSAPSSMFPFAMGLPGAGQEGEASKNLQELLQRQLQFPGMLNPLLGFPGMAGAGAPAAPNQQFQGLFNMFLSEMLKKVQKDTPPQTPPSSPPPSAPSQEESCVEET